MWGDDYLDDYHAGRTPPPATPRPVDCGSPWISLILIAIAIALILTCVPGSGS